MTIFTATQLETERFAPPATLGTVLANVLSGCAATVVSVTGIDLDERPLGVRRQGSAQATFEVRSVVHGRDPSLGSSPACNRSRRRARRLRTPDAESPSWTAISFESRPAR